MANLLPTPFVAFLVLMLSLSPATIPCFDARRHHSPALIVPTSKHALDQVRRNNVPQEAAPQTSVTLDPLEQVDGNLHRSNNVPHAISKLELPGKENDRAGVIIRSSPAHPMPTDKQQASPTPLPQFPTLGPPIVWSFPATPLPPLEAPPPQDLPAMPKTGSKHGAAPPEPCQGADHYRRHRLRLPPSVPFVAAEPATSPGPLEAPESAPAPSAGGPVSPPYP